LLVDTGDLLFVAPRTWLLLIAADVELGASFTRFAHASLTIRGRGVC
jgi:hypothetical protein